MRRIYEAIVPVVAATTLVAGCADTYEIDLSEPSRVVNLEFIPEHTESVQGGCLYSDKGICYIYNYYDETIPNEWTVTIEQCEGGPVRTQEEELCSVRTISISAEDFSILSLNDRITIDEDGVDRVPR